MEWGALGRARVGGSLYGDVQCIIVVPPWIDRHDWKNYLPVTSLAGGNKKIYGILTEQRTDRQTSVSVLHVANSSDGREDVWGAIAERQECDALNAARSRKYESETQLPIHRLQRTLYFTCDQEILAMKWIAPPCSALTSAILAFLEESENSEIPFTMVAKWPKKNSIYNHKQGTNIFISKIILHIISSDS